MLSLQEHLRRKQLNSGEIYQWLKQSWKDWGATERKEKQCGIAEGMLGNLFCWTCELHGKEKDAVTESKSWVFFWGERQSDARSLSRQFTQDTRQVYTKFETIHVRGRRLATRYQEKTNNSSHGNGGDTFEIVEEGSILWQSPWELSSTGNKMKHDLKLDEMVLVKNL